MSENDVTTMPYDLDYNYKVKQDSCLKIGRPPSLKELLSQISQLMRKFPPLSTYLKCT